MPFKVIVSLILFALTVLMIASCTQLPSSRPQEYTTEQRLNQQVSQSLLSARNSTSPDKEFHLYSAAKAYDELGEHKLAAEILAGIDNRQLPAELLAEYTLLYTKLLLSADEYVQARALLTNPHLMEIVAALTKARQIELRRARASLFSLLGENSLAAIEYVELSRSLTSPTAIKENNNEVWKLLSRISDTELQNLMADQTDSRLAGWFHLALATRASSSYISRQQQQIEHWRERWPDHPAASFPPQYFLGLEQAAAALPNRLALFVPLTGSYGLAGRAVRNGFVAAHYDNLSKGGHVPSLYIYDTTEQSIDTLYQQAVTDQVDIVIGPLRKENLATLNDLEELPVPVIGLNYFDDDRETKVVNHKSLYQFGLSIKDEAVLVAERAWLEGHRSVMVLSPATAWGDGARQNFIANWKTRGGNIVEATPYSPSQSDYSNVIKPALLIDQSSLRTKKLQRTLGKNLAYQPRRRQDIDAIFLVAQAEQGRSIKPALDFFYAHELPVFATSHIYTGTENTDLNRDLEGIRFSAMPWTISDALPNRLLPDLSLPSSYRHLYALGVDAYQLHQHFALMKRSPQIQFFGHTGILTITAENTIKRAQPWAEFKNSKVRLARAASENQ